MTDLYGFQIDTSDALYAPSRKQLKRRVERLAPDLWKIGSCFQDRLDVRSRDGAHYSDNYFNRDGSVCLAYGLDDTERAAVLETTAIQHAKFKLCIGVNDKSRDDVPHDGYPPLRPGALYAVPVLPHITTQHQFKDVHVSWYMDRTHGNTTKEDRKAAKRAKLLDALITAIPMQQLQRAFVTSHGTLNKLQRKYDFKLSNNEIYKDLQTLFDELY